MVRVVILLCAIAVATALPTPDVVISKLVPDGLRYNYAEAEDGQLHLVDSWVKLSDLERMARYDPDRQNEYHLFTRDNPTRSQPILNGNVQVLGVTNFRASKRTIVLIHGFLGSATAASNAALVPAFLAAEDVNVIVVDWSAGAYWGLNGIQSGRAVAGFINWLNSVTGANAGQYHILGFSVGGHQAGIVARHVNGDVAYVTGLDPASRWEINEILSPNDSLYTEVIHTSAGVNGWGDPLGHVDFYPNGGIHMPGCGLINVICDHNRSYEYMAESLRSGGFMGVQCLNRNEAYLGSCTLSNRLRMGGITPKTGQTGIYYMRTNRGPPFSQG